MKENENYIFFWDGVFSQWYPMIFKVGVNTFSCAEQYMMYHKALTFNDTTIAHKIMKTTSPKEQKALGRMVKNFNEDKWNSVAKDIVYQGNYFKFTRNEYLLNCLKETYPKILVEASPYDKIWGIGLAADDKRAQTKSTWQGKNWLGEVLTKLRNDIMNKGSI